MNIGGRHGTSRAVARVSWEIAYGVIPGDMNICHHCDNPYCVRPEHLFLGTDADNHRDRDAKGRQARGEQLPIAKLTAEQVAAIRARYAEGRLSMRILSKEYDVAPDTIRLLIKRATWKHVQ